MRRKPGELLPLEKWLLEQLDSPMYGYQLEQAAMRGYKLLGSGTITRALHRLEEMGLLRSWQEIVNGRVRRYYERTAIPANAGMSKECADGPY